MAVRESHITSHHLLHELRRFATAESQKNLIGETSGVLKGSSAKTPDLLYHPTGHAPVLIECKYESISAQLITQAKNRFAHKTENTSEEIETVFMVLYPDKWKEMNDDEIAKDLRSDKPCLKWALYQNTDHSGTLVRMPESGWHPILPSNLMDLIEICSISAKQVAYATNRLQETIKTAGALISNWETHAQKVAEELRQNHDTTADKDQASRMAAMLITNAFMFQDVLSNSESQIPSVNASRTPGTNDLEVKHVVTEWSNILEINWWPIFHVAKNLVTKLPPREASRILDQCAEGATQMLKANLGSVQDMVGQMFGRLVTDRDLLKAHYTRVEAATLLAELAVARMNITDWDELKERLEESDNNDFLVADFACGTGTLLTAAYRRLMSRARRAGVNDFDLHKPMIENGIVGLDVLPASTHLTAMMLSSAYPSVVYKHTNIHLVPFGCDLKNPTIAYMGSLELLAGVSTQSLFGEFSAGQISGTGETQNNASTVNVGNGSCQLVIMNPPYASFTKSDGTGSALAAFGASIEEQEGLKQRLTKITKEIKPKAHNKSAGLATSFFDLAHAKVKKGGCIAMVLPLTMCNGYDWKNLREILKDWYDNIVFVAVAGSTYEQRQFSADTGLAELLLVAKRRRAKRSPKANPTKIRWVSLTRRPGTETEAVIIAEKITLASRKSGTTAIVFGDDNKGLIVTGDINDGGTFGVSSSEVITAVVALSNAQLDLPRIPSIDVPIVPLGELGENLDGDRNIAVHRIRKVEHTDRAPFFIDEKTGSGTSAYPLLWGHESNAEDHGRESKIEVVYDRTGTVRPGLDDKAKRIWKKNATKFVLNRDFGFNSHRLAICVTPEKVLGGRSWSGYKLDNPNWGKFLALWGNTTFGLVAYWFKGTRQQNRRSTLTGMRQGELPVYDPRELTDKQKKKIPTIFNKFKVLDLLPANQADEDKVRIDLDKSVLCDLLELHKLAKTSEDEFMESLAILRLKWCEEPHIARSGLTTPGTA